MCLGQDTWAMDIRLVEICPLVWWVQMWDVGSNLCVFVRRRVGERMISVCVVVWVTLLVTLSDLFWIQGILNQRGYHSILQRCAIWSGLRLVGRSFDPKHASRRVPVCCIRWPGLHNHPTSTQLRWFGMSWTRVKEKQPTGAQHMWELFQDCWKSIPHEAGWEKAKSVQSCQGKGCLLWSI
jgi:hypothetical protein